ncbi:hypothetical protein K504DRAFT_446269 [Pleomassaria siparia CBS 279.74]|uniref:RING-type domain-containing protein n=1 Tax=Pleomassaria siparia CBS 279.74 TaxID=1314801 RepID=A0A6G1KSV7_9PLEO|nr:hypothetical protein K504DRAFT_446269 [Pleomassaria siparia CBS 279.74]
MAANNQEDFFRTGLKDYKPSRIPGRERKKCSICLDDLTSSEKGVKIRQCSHTFHYDCLLGWLKSQNRQHSSCPNCRIELFPSQHMTLQTRIQDEITRAVERGDLEPLGVHPSLSIRRLEDDSEYRAVMDRLLTTEILASQARDDARDDDVASIGSEHHDRSGSRAFENGTFNLDLYVQDSARVSRARRDLDRATRVLTGQDPLPLSISPVTENGEYIGIEQRRRQQLEGRIRRATPNMSDDQVQEEVDRQWNQRTHFMLDLEQLESIREFVGAPGADLGQRQLNNAQLLRYGLLLSRVFPSGRLEPHRRIQLVGANLPILEDEVHHFFSTLDDHLHEQRLNDETLRWNGDRDDERRFRDNMQEVRRLTDFVTSGASRHYILRSSPRSNRHSETVLAPVHTPVRSGTTARANGMTSRFWTFWARPPSSDIPQDSAPSDVSNYRGSEILEDDDPARVRAPLNAETLDAMDTTISGFATANASSADMDDMLMSQSAREYARREAVFSGEAFNEQESDFSRLRPPHRPILADPEWHAYFQRLRLGSYPRQIQAPSSEQVAPPDAPGLHSPSETTVLGRASRVGITRPPPLHSRSTSKISVPSSVRPGFWSSLADLFTPSASRPSISESETSPEATPAPEPAPEQPEPEGSIHASPPTADHLISGAAKYLDLFPNLGSRLNARSLHPMSSVEMPRRYLPIFEEFRSRILRMHTDPLIQIQLDQLFPRAATMICLTKERIEDQARFLRRHCVKETVSRSAFED